MSEESKVHRSQYAKKKGEVFLRDHEYDGIREYDQMLPGWWLVIFFSALIFALGYWVVYYQLGWMKTDAERIGAAMVKIEQVKAAALEEMLSQLDDEAFINHWSRDAERVEAGRQVYQANCIGCHGGDLAARIDIGGGQFVSLPGLSLVDGEWKYGSAPMDVFKIIHDGTPGDSPGHNGAKMEPWGNKIPPLQIAELTAYLIHANPADFPAPPGE
jgi:cytochrome c oxidase cbb3-type subunit III